MVSSTFCADVCDILASKHETSSPAISHYGDYLEGMYRRCSVSSDGKFPPTPSKKYVNLAVVKHGKRLNDLEELMKQTLHGNLNKILEGRVKVEIEDILKLQEDGNPVTLVLVEGPPGVGKSTLAWELCRRWDRSQYSLAVLLRLREREVQQIKVPADLFPHIDRDLQQSVAKNVLIKEGKGVLFILDGYDELPPNLRREGLLFKLLKGEALPKCTVVITSRPSATSDLHMTCRPQVKRHIEILGFTQECVKEYAASVFSSDPNVLRDFLFYISASQNPAINSLMYIPLNAAIIVEIYSSNRRKGFPIPKTMTQLYTQLCLTLLQRYMQCTDPHSMFKIADLSSLPGAYDASFKMLSQIAFEKFAMHEVAFYSDSVPDNLVHFGFLDSVSSLCGGGVSYNFLHFTIQEFLAAHHITQLPNGSEIFNQHCSNKRWMTVWRFVSGLTRFRYFEQKFVRNRVFCDTKGDYLEVTQFLIDCLYEAQIEIDYELLFGSHKLTVDKGIRRSTSSLDKYALGYCIAKSSSATSWEVYLFGGSAEALMWGLKSWQYGHGSIHHLTLSQVFSTCLDLCPPFILQAIKHLSIFHMLGLCVTATKLLGNVIPLMTHLSSVSLQLESYTTEVELELLNKLCSTKVTSLELLYHKTSFVYDHGFLTILANLIDPSSGKLKRLCLQPGRLGVSHGQVDTTSLCKVLFESSSLDNLSIFPKLAICVELLETNTCLSQVHIVYKETLIASSPLSSLTKLLRVNNTIETLSWAVSHEHLNEQCTREFSEAFHSNTTLKVLNLCIDHEMKPDFVTDIFSDPRLNVSVGQ